MLFTNSNVCSIISKVVDAIELGDRKGATTQEVTENIDA